MTDKHNVTPTVIYTTGQVASICGVACRTVSKWFDSGRLRGYRLPGSADRRIPQNYLIQFMVEHGLPLPPELQAVADAAKSPSTSSSGCSGGSPPRSTG